MPGYSGTALPKKLGIKDGFRVYFVEAPQEVIAQLKPPLARCKIERDGKVPIDWRWCSPNLARR